VLLALQDESVLSAFRDALLRPLEEHDARRHTELVRTLELFLESGAAYQRTADTLHVHVNTLRLRLARIEELTGRSLSDMEARVDFFIALRSRR
jgi:DNA-binding PucR family transcriptional regulator